MSSSSSASTPWISSYESTPTLSTSTSNISTIAMTAYSYSTSCNFVKAYYSTSTAAAIYMISKSTCYSST